MKCMRDLLVLQAAVGIVLASAMVYTARAQHPSRPRVVDPADAASVENARREREMLDRDLSERQAMLRMLKPDAGRGAERQGPRLDLAQIREDFIRLQAVAYNMARAASAGAALDLRSVAKSASEVRKRAERLKANLVLPEPEKAPERPEVEIGAGAEQLRSSVSALGELVSVFANNPVFGEVKVVDAELSAKARYDLDGIIKLSGRLKKSSEKLSKVAQKPH